MTRRLILFDIDGTLLISKGLGREAKRRAMLEVFGTAGDILTHHFGGKTDWQLLIETLAEHHITPDEIEAKMTVYLEAMSRHMAAISPEFDHVILPGALELVHRTRGNPDNIVGVVTGNNIQTAPIKLQGAGFDPAWFVVGAYGNESADRHDLPRLALQRANQLLDAPIPPERVVVIGDTVMDVTSAQAMGAVSVAVLTGFEEPAALEAAQPDYLLDDLTQFDAQVTLP